MSIMPTVRPFRDLSDANPIHAFGLCGRNCSGGSQVDQVIEIKVGVWVGLIVGCHTIESDTPGFGGWSQQWAMAELQLGCD